MSHFLGLLPVTTPLSLGMIVVFSLSQGLAYVNIRYTTLITSFQDIRHGRVGRIFLKSLNLLRWTSCTLLLVPRQLLTNPLPSSTDTTIPESSSIHRHCIAT